MMGKKKEHSKIQINCEIDVEYTLDSYKCYFNRKGFAFYSEIHVVIRKTKIICITWE